MADNSISTDQWLAAAKHRSSIYKIGITCAVSDSRIEEILQHALFFGPSSYNTQPARLTLCTGEKHKGLWDIFIKTAEPILLSVNEGVWSTMDGVMKSEKGAYGSVRAFSGL